MISQAHQPGPSGVLDVAGLRRFVKVCRMPMALLNLETRLMDSVNEAFAGLLGYTPEELEGRGPAVLHADQAGADEQIAKAVQLLLQTGTVHVERELRNKRGEHRTCDVHGSLMIRRPTPFAVLVIRDVSARRQTELEQRMMAAKLTALFENMPAGVVFADRETGALIHANKAAADLLGRRIDPAIGYDDFSRAYGLERADGSTYPVPVLPIRRVASTGQHVHADDLFIRRPDGSRIQIEVWAGPVSWSGGPSFDAIIAVYQDITQRKEQERALQQEQIREQKLREQLHRDEKMRSIATLAGGVAHDFNNILVSILGNASMLQSEIEPGHKWHQPISAILNGAERAAAVVRQLLDYAQGREGITEARSLHSMIEDALPLCRSAVPGNVEIKFDVRCDDEVVQMDPIQMQQVLLNLTMNAAEAMPAGGRIELETTRCGGPHDTPLEDRPCLCLRVQDQGSGIDAEIAQKIFDPFCTTKGLGRGLGLASVYGILDSHGAQIHLSSNREQGAEFAIYFPARSAAPDT